MERLAKIREKLNKEKTPQPSDKTKPTDAAQPQDQAKATAQAQVQSKKSLKSLIYYYISFGYWNTSQQSDSTLKKD